MKTNPTRMVKTFIGISSLLLLTAGARAQFTTIPVYEPFGEYTEGVWIGKNTATQDPFNDPAVYANWTWGNSMNTNASPHVSATNALSYPGLLPDPNSPAKGIEGVTLTTSGRSACAPYPIQTTGTNYLSFLLNLQTLPSGDRPIIGLHENATGLSASPTAGVSVWVTSTGQLKIGKSSNAAALTNTTPALVIGSTYFVVLAYTFTNNQTALWLNPTVLGNNANIPPPTISSTNGTSSPQLQSICLFYPNGGNILSSNQFDELRVGTNWSQVTPADCSPGTTYNVTGGGSGCPGSSFAVGLTGSDSGVKYLLYTNSAFSGQTVTGTGSPFTFGLQSVSGIYTVVASNSTPCLGWMSGSVTVSVLASPAIVTQPAAAVVATNGFGVFSVVATGDGLAYQWYKNGVGLTDGGRISGSQTNNLVISPATTADTATAANGYYVIITNNCGYSAISITNGLTLDAAANLTWRGNGSVNLWDVSTTADWTNGVATVVFNSGDNVTFDDGAATNVVNLANSHLAPGSINVNSAINYTFTGSGAIVGTNSLIKSGSGTLTNKVATSYTGGTTINNGTINIASSAAATGLGSGTVTLAGGTLQFSTGLGFNGPSIGFNNDINVAAPSTIEMDGTGSQGCVLLGDLTGTPGTSLTILDPSTGTLGRIRMYGNFTNSLNIVLSSGGPSVPNPTTLQFAPANTNASQIYNGVISGDGQVISRNSGGQVIFNAQNTFTGYQPFSANMSFVLSAGSVGIGVNSISTSPPTVNSGPLGTGQLMLSAETSSTANSGSATLFASGGSRTLHNPMQYLQGTNLFTFIIGGSNNLTLAGALNLVALDGITFTNRIIRVDNTALTTMSGVIDDAGLGCPVTKAGAGTLALSAVNTYAGPTVISNGTLQVIGRIGTNTVTVAGGTLGGSGTVLGPVTVSSGGTLAPGTSAIGTLTVNNSLTNNGNLFFKLQKGQPQSNDIASVSGTLTSSGAGALTVSNLGPALVVGDKFKLFNKVLANGSTLGVSGGGVLWINNLQVDGSITVTSGTVPTPVINSVILQNGTNLVFSGTNGVVGGSYSILSSTNLTTPLANWVLQASGTFSGTGGFSYTNIITPGVPVRFLLLQIP
jgi:autotransporter-associated beta strand protein